MTLPIFPSQTLLPGLGYNVKWSPVYFDQTQKNERHERRHLALAISALQTSS